MKKLLYILPLLLTIQLYGQSDPFPLVYEQHYIVPGNVQNNDSIGRFHYPCTDTLPLLNYYIVDSVYTWSIYSGNGSGMYAINSSTGMLRMADNSGYTAGKDSLYIVIQEGTRKDTALAIINKFSVANSVYINPDWGGTESGTYAEPYNDWTSLSNVYETDKAYFQKRGTTATGKIYTGLGAEDSLVYFGAYGTGAKPIIDKATGEAISTGNNPTDTSSYIYFFDFDIKNTVDPYHHVRIGYNSKQIHFERIDIDDYGGSGLSPFYMVWAFFGEGTISLTSCTVRNVQSGRFLKATYPDVTVTNFYGYNTKDGDGMSITEGPGFTGRFIMLDSCSRRGIEDNRANMDIQYLYIRNNHPGYAAYPAIYIYPDAQTYNNGDYSDFFYRDFVLEDVGMAINIGNNSQVYDSTHNIIFERGKIINSKYIDYCIRVDEDVSNLTFSHIQFVDIADTNGTYCFDELVDSVYIYNNTFINNGRYDVYDNTSDNVTIVNTIYDSIYTTGSFDLETNYNFDDTLGMFLKDNRDNFLLNTDSLGTDLGYTFDQRLYYIIGLPSVGAYDYDGNTSGVPAPVGKIPYRNGTQQSTYKDGILQQRWKR